MAPTTESRPRVDSQAARINQRRHPTTALPKHATPRKPLTAQERGVFWTSVGDAIEAARKAGAK